MAGRLASRYPEQHPRCLLHVPKCAGNSVDAALRAALPTASVSVKHNDTAWLCCGFTAFDELGPQARESLLVEERELDEMLRSDLVIGHFSLRTLLKVAPAESIATVLREPRARLLSLYAYFRLTPGEDELWHPYRPRVHALRPLDEFLSEPLMAPAVDNAVCRMVLHSDPRIPGLDFIPAEHVQGLASDAVARLDHLGFVGVLERPRTTWEGLSRFFGVPLEPDRVNATTSAGAAPDYVPVKEPISDRTLDLLRARTAADALVFRQVLMAETTAVRAKQISDAAFAAQLFRFGEVAGRSAASAQSLSHRVAETESQIASLAEQLSRREEELARHRSWLEGIQGSVSWRMTSPLRAAKRRVLTAKPR